MYALSLGAPSNTNGNKLKYLRARIVTIFGHLSLKLLTQPLIGKEAVFVLLVLFIKLKIDTLVIIVVNCKISRLKSCKWYRVVISVVFIVINYIFNKSLCKGFEFKLAAVAFVKFLAIIVRVADGMPNEDLAHVQRGVWVTTLQPVNWICSLDRLTPKTTKQDSTANKGKESSGAQSKASSAAQSQSGMPPIDAVTQNLAASSPAVAPQLADNLSSAADNMAQGVTLDSHGKDRNGPENGATNANILQVIDLSLLAEQFHVLQAQLQQAQAAQARVKAQLAAAQQNSIHNIMVPHHGPPAPVPNGSIPKPKGSAGGGAKKGYKLQDAMGLGEANEDITYKNILVIVLAAHVPPLTLYNDLTPQQLSVMLAAACKEQLYLAQFALDWATTAMMKQYMQSRCAQY
ncbi:hypothetical protein BC835DRAFT_1310195 [Cytidiella melzeri]|nr:hypothetical protein BC835DRAFT_1310195 [Cytidiella melzeri]